MPLVVVCGRPATGKTTFATTLADYLVAAGVPASSVVILNDEALGGRDRRAGYASACAALGKWGGAAGMLQLHTATSII